MYGRNDRGFPPKPVEVGEEIEVTIEAVGEKGDGVAKKDGFVLFVPGAKQGQKIKVKVTKVLRKVGFAEIIGDATGEAPVDSASSDDVIPAEEPEPIPEDSDDFGEETPAEENNDEPAKESEKAPVEKNNDEPVEEQSETPTEEPTSTDEEPKNE